MYASVFVSLCITFVCQCVWRISICRCVCVSVYMRPAFLLQVPYTFDSSLSSNTLVKSIMNEGLLQYHALTNLRWVPWTNQSDYVIFQSSPGLCASSIGRIGGPQIVHLDGSGLCPPGSTVHEMAHVFGLFHTQARTDRDQYINVHWPNIQPNASDNYLQYNQLPNCDHCGQDALAYDYGSVMHYWNTEFLASNASGLTTFDPIPGPFNAFQAKYGNVTIGQRVGLSPIDLALLNLMYSSCLDNPPASTC